MSDISTRRRHISHIIVPLDLKWLNCIQEYAPPKYNLIFRDTSNVRICLWVILLLYYSNYKSGSTNFISQHNTLIQDFHLRWIYLHTQGWWCKCGCLQKTPKATHRSIIYGYISALCLSFPHNFFQLLQHSLINVMRRKYICKHRVGEVNVCACERHQRPLRAEYHLRRCTLRGLY